MVGQLLSRQSSQISGRDRYWLVNAGLQNSVAHEVRSGPRDASQKGGGSSSGVRVGSVWAAGGGVAAVGGVGISGSGQSGSGSISGPGGRVVRLIPVGVVMVRVASSWKWRVQPGAWCLSLWWVRQ